MTLSSAQHHSYFLATLVAECAALFLKPKREPTVPVKCVEQLQEWLDTSPDVRFDLTE